MVVDNKPGRWIILGYHPNTDIPVAFGTATGGTFKTEDAAQQVADLLKERGAITIPWAARLEKSL